ncbi:hypothetical protein [Actinoplanes italicus]|uniref:Uncharacterized protein n=1 Tax=Actinoplanes italicus TaxID=113567 RepID=A0A2T0K5B1_9ACTN|nr:hypothetical protein [Actinoplanes italicus]PRX18087.1 hypothetical protein CLV67_114259 [Actinoplanes italicus]
MGYSTDFAGQVAIVPPLNPSEVEYLDRFAETRHELRDAGPYAVSGFGLAAEDMYGGNEPPPQQPGYWCKWVPTAAGDALTWNGAEKFYDAEVWLAYLIDTFLRPGSAIRGETAPGWVLPPLFEHFTCDHVLNGVIVAQGEEEDDRWRIEVRDNVVHVVRPPSWPADGESADGEPADGRPAGGGSAGEGPAGGGSAGEGPADDHVFVVGANGDLRDLGPAVSNGFEN